MTPSCNTEERKHSWASEVEEDQETTGWDADEAPVEDNLLPVYPAVPAKSKKSKKKKKGCSRRVDKEPAPSSSVAATYAESEFRNLAVSVEARVEQQSTQVDYHNDDNDGWQVSSSRRTRHQQSNQTFFASSNNFVGSVARATSGRVSIQMNPYARQMPQQKPKNHQNFTPTDGPPNVCGNDLLHRRPPKVQAPAPKPFQLQAHTDGQPNVYGNDVLNTRPSKVRAQAPKSNEVDTQNDAKHAVSSWARVAQRNVPNSDIDILSKLLPSENLAPIDISQIGTINSRTETVKHCFVEVPEAPFPIDSDSVCSDADLEDDSDWIGSDPFDSDASVKSLDTRKLHKGFHNFFQTLDELSNGQILDIDRQWHCPVCQGGVGGIDWYKGLQPLIAHAKTHRTKRVGLHRDFAKILEEDLEKRRAGISVSETKFGKWKGLQGDDESKDPNVVWPPMVIVQNTLYELDDQEKWIGMGNKELMDMFAEYSPMKARHSYGPHGHRGMSVVIFSDSPTGYFNAERLAKHFRDSRRGRANWENPGKIIFHPGGDRILYGYMPTAEDMEMFNKHSVGKSKLKWELKKFKDAVTEPMKQMDEENQRVHYYKFKMQKHMEHSKTLERSVSVFSKKLELRENEIAIIRQRANEQYKENQTEMDDLERTFKERILQLQKESAKKEQEVMEKQEAFKLEHIERRQQLELSLENELQEPKQAKMKKEIEQQTDMLELSLQECEDFEYKKRELQKHQHLRKRELLRNHYEQQLSLEREFKNEMQALLEKYMKAK